MISFASFSGNVSVGGTLTYEDVTNIDSVGIVTARQGIDIQGGIGVTFADNVVIPVTIRLESVVPPVTESVPSFV